MANHSEEHVYISNLSTDLSTNSMFSTVDLSQRIGMGVSLSVNWSITLAVNLLVCKSALKHKSPINVMIVVDELEKLFGLTYMTLEHMTNNPHTKEDLGCMHKIMGSFFFTTLFLNGLTTSALRNLYIHGQNIIRVWGEKKVAGLVLLTSQIAIVLVTLMVSFNHNHRFPCYVYTRFQSLKY